MSLPSTGHGARRYARRVNLVGHVAVAVQAAPSAPAPYLVGCMLPDLAAMARVRLRPATGLVGDGVAFHHGTDAAFHSSRWFNEHNVTLRDLLLEAGVDRGAARASAHAGLEMLLDGDLANDPAVTEAVARTFDALIDGATARAVLELAPEHSRRDWSDRLTRIGRSLDVASYQSGPLVAERLHRMTRGRSRIELRSEQIGMVAAVLTAYRPHVVAGADDAVAQVLATVESSTAWSR